jgi:hypothetical protein
MNQQQAPTVIIARSSNSFLASVVAELLEVIGSNPMLAPDPFCSDCEGRSIPIVTHGK